MNNRFSKQFFAALMLAGMLFSAVPFTAAQTHGLDIAGMDKSVAPGDDFFHFVNGGWLKATEIPADRTSFGAFDVIFDTVSKRTANIITEAASSSDPEARMVGDYYKAFLDEAMIEK